MNNIDILKIKIKIYEKTLLEIANAGSNGDSLYLSILAKSVLNGKDLISDEYNIGDDIEYNFIKLEEKKD